MSQTYYRSFIKDNSVVVGGHMLIYLKGIIIMPIIIKSVGATTYGGFALLTSILGIAFGISSLGAGFKAKRFLPSAETMLKRGDLFYPQFYFNVLTILVLSLLFLLLENPLKEYFFRDEISFSIWIIPLYLVFYLLYSQGSNYFRYTSRVQYMTLANFCFSYIHIGFILLYLYVYGSINIDVLVISMTVSALSIAVPTFLGIFRELGVKFSFYKDKSLISDIRLGFPLVLGNIVDFILAVSDRYIIALFLSVTAVGYYVPAYALGSLIVFIPKAIGTALPQLLSRAIDNGNESEAYIMLNYAIKVFLLLSIPFVFGCLALGKQLLTLFANQEVAENAFLVMPIVALASLFYGLNLLFFNVLFVRSKTSAIFRMNLMASLFNLVTNFILLYFFRNIIVAAITTFLSYLIAFLYVYRKAMEEWSIDFEWVSIIKSIAASAIMFGIISLFVTYFNHVNAAVLFAYLFGGIIIYIGSLVGFRTFSDKEVRFLRKLFAQ